MLVTVITHKSLFCLSSYFQSTENGRERMHVYVTIQAFVTYNPTFQATEKAMKNKGSLHCKLVQHLLRVCVHASVYLQQADLIQLSKASLCMAAQSFLHGKSLSMWHSPGHSNSLWTAVVVFLDWTAFRNINIQLFPGKTIIRCYL